MHNSTIGRRSINHRSASGINSYMTSHNDYISSLQLGCTDLFKAPRTSPTGRSHIGSSHSGLIKTPVYKAGAVERIRSFGAPYIGRANLGRGNGNKGRCRSGYCCSAQTGRDTSGGTAVSASRIAICSSRISVISASFRLRLCRAGLQDL